MKIVTTETPNTEPRTLEPLKVQTLVVAESRQIGRAHV